MSLWSRILRFDSRKRELAAEIQSHMRMAIGDRIARGETPEEARAAAMRELGNVPLIEDVTRETWGWMWLERLLQDLNYALRQMQRSPGFAAMVIGTLALGIGAATAMFTVVDHVLLNPLPYKDSDRLVVISKSNGKSSFGLSPSWSDIQQWKKQSRSFESIAFWAGMEGYNYLETSSGSERILGERVSSNLFGTLGIRPEIGSGFVRETQNSSPDQHADTIVLSHVLWKEVFGGAKEILGKTVRIDDNSYTVVGVMPAGFRFPAGPGVWPQVWVPIQPGRDEIHPSSGGYYSVLARLRNEASVRSARAEMNVIQSRVAAHYPSAYMRRDQNHVFLKNYAASLVTEKLRAALLALFAATGVLWLIAVVNITNLLLVRSTVRQREIAMRGALGASRRRLVQQLLVEILVMTSTASVLGVGLAFTSVKVLAHELSEHLPLPAPAPPDAQILLELLSLTAVTVLIAGIWPALQAVRAPIEPALRQGSVQSGTGLRSQRLRYALVTTEVALSLTLLVGCGLLLRTIYTLSHVPLGFRTDHIIVANLEIPSFRFAGRNLAADLYEPLLDRAQHLRGVQSAGLMTNVPLAMDFISTMGIYNEQGEKSTFLFKAATVQIQTVFGLRMAAGRYFGPRDTATSQPVAVVNEAFARTNSPNEHNPNAIVGTMLFNDVRKGEPIRVIGVLSDERQLRVEELPRPEVEICLPQITPKSPYFDSTEGIAMDLAVRTDQPTKAIIPEIRDLLHQASPELANATITTMDQIVEDSYGSQRLAAHLLEIFGGCALLLCLAGIYGLLAYVVTQRTREMGVRIALGATRGNLRWLIMWRAGGMLIAGLAVGTVLAWFSARLVRSYLYGVGAHDGWTLAGAAALLCASGLLAAYIPARRAARVDPIVALRAE